MRSLHNLRSVEVDVIEVDVAATDDAPVLAGEIFLQGREDGRGCPDRDDECPHRLALACGRVLGRGTARRLRIGESPFPSGGPPRHLHVVVSGCVEVVTHVSSGTYVRLAIAGSILGAESLGVIDRREIASATCETVVASYSARGIRRRVEGDPSLTTELLALVAWAVDHGDEFAAAVVPSLEARVVRQLLRLSLGERRFEVPCTQTQLARSVHGSRERVNKVLAALRARGLVEIENHVVTFLDRPALERVAALPAAADTRHARVP